MRLLNFISSLDGFKPSLDMLVLLSHNIFKVLHIGQDKVGTYACLLLAIHLVHYRSILVRLGGRLDAGRDGCNLRQLLDVTVGDLAVRLFNLPHHA